MNALTEIKEIRGSKYINFSSRFNVADHSGNQTDGKRMMLTSRDGVVRFNNTIGIAEAQQLVADAIEAGAETINFSCTITSDNNRLLSKLAKLVEKRAIQCGQQITRLGEYFYKR
tara:strand:+ start:3046 stop:3390 length:345 start_codon:yes stop_codon:yes gene_type:complete